MFHNRAFLFVTAVIIPFNLQAEKPGDFAHTVAPILRKHCVECHGGKEAKGGFSINTRKSFLDEDYAIPNESESSYFLDLILSEDPETQMPPPEMTRLTEKEIETLKRWVDSGMKWESEFTFAAQTYEPPLKPFAVELPTAVDGRNHPIDRLLDEYLSENKVTRPEPISDATFYRRVSLDLVGLLPPPNELNEFLKDDSPDKRNQLIEQLLSQQIDYADHWLTFWNDLLRNDYTGTGFITGGRKQITGWLYESLLLNKPYDQFAQELIAPSTADSRGFIDGIKWRGEVSAGQTLEIQFAQSVSQAFLGLNLKCASCHDSFVDRWTLKEAYGLAAIYSQRELMIHRCDKPTGETAQAAWLFPELGNVDAAASQADRLNQLANLMTHPENGRFTRTIVNRLWAQLMGRGLVHPLDAMQSEPWNEDLLELLSNHLRENQYDLKSVLKLIASSEAYQSRMEVLTQAKSDEGYTYRGPRSKRMTAEQFMDGVWQISHAGPNRYEAPLFRAPISEAEANKFQLQGKWIWRTPVSTEAASVQEEKSDETPADEGILFKKTIHLDDVVQIGAAAIVSEKKYALYINNQEVSSQQRIGEVDRFLLHPYLKPGENEIIIYVKQPENSLKSEGFNFEASLGLANGTKVRIQSDETWQWNDEIPKQRARRLGKITGAWKSVLVSNSSTDWTNKTETQVKKINSRIVNGEFPMVRASLMNSDFLMRSLGRPLREQIVSSRPSELTTLEAIDLTNGATLANTLHEGGKNIIDKDWDSPQALIDHLFLAALSRVPSEDESRVILGSLDATPTVQQVEDLLWVLVLMPEFMLIH